MGDIFTVKDKEKENCNVDHMRSSIPWKPVLRCNATYWIQNSPHALMGLTTLHQKMKIFYQNRKRMTPVVKKTQGPAHSAKPPQQPRRHTAHSSLTLLPTDQTHALTALPFRPMCLLFNFICVRISKTRPQHSEDAGDQRKYKKRIVAENIGLPFPALI